MIKSVYYEPGTVLGAVDTTADMANNAAPTDLSVGSEVDVKKPVM